MIKGRELKIDLTEVYLFSLPASKPSERVGLAPRSKKAKKTIARTT